MKSPFSVFRKHQKSLMVLLVIMAMFAFTLLDSLSSTNESNPTLLGLMIGAGLFGLLGLVRGRVLEYALGGAVLGGLAGLLASMQGVGLEPAVVSTAVGDFRHRDLNRMVTQRQIANQFMEQALTRAQGSPPGRSVFSFGRPIEEDVVIAQLLREEADEMGIVVSNEAVTNFINQATSKKLSKQNFTDIRNSMRLSESDLYNILRDELKAQLAFTMAVPRQFQPPERYWQYYKRLNVKQELEVAALEVEAFTPLVSDPSEKELLTFFNQYKEQFPHQAGAGTPGFRQPRKVALAYLEADYKTFEDRVAPGLEEEIAQAEKEGKPTLIEQYYEANKETLYKNKRIPDEPASEDGAPGEKKEGEKKTGDESNPLDPEFTPDAKPSEEKAEKKPAEKKPDEKSDGEKPDGESNDDDSNSSKTDGDATSAAGPDSSGLAGAARGPSADEPATADEFAFSFVSASDDELESGSDEPAPQPTSEQPAKEDSPPAKEDADDANDDAKPVKEQAKQETSPEAKEPDAPMKEKKSDAAKDAPADDAPATDKEDAKDATKDAKDEAPELPEYRPLDDLLKGQIRDQLLRERTFAAMRKVIDEATSEMSKLSDDYHLLPTDPQAKPITPEEMAARLKQFAKKNGLHYEETGLLSAEELARSEEHPIGAATDPVETEFERQNVRTVVDHLFDQSDQLYYQFQAEDPVTSNRFAYWKTADKQAHVPEYDEPGVREQVLRAWKEAQARPLAEKRAEELKAKVVESVGSGRSMAEALADQTVTGKEDGLQVTVRHTEPFSWLRTSTAPPTSFFDMSVPELSTISAVDQAGEEFMRTVFEELKNNEVGVVPNADRSAYYIVQVQNRTPASPETDAQFKQKFLDERLFGPFIPMLGQRIPTAYDHIADRERQELYFKWNRQLEEKYAVRWNLDRQP